MFSSRSPSRALGSRLDAGFYNPEYFTCERALERFRRDTLESLRQREAKISYGVIKPIFTDSECAMVRIQDFDDPFIDIEKSARIAQGQAKAFSRSECRCGDLLLAIGGYPGRLGIVGKIPHGINHINVNQHVVRIRFQAGRVSPYFVAPMLMSSYGLQLLSRQVSGSVQAGINVEDLREVRVPRFALVAEEYIGTKVRHAEALRGWARELEQKIQSRFDSLHRMERTREVVSWRCSARSLSDERLDASFYSPPAVALDARLTETGALRLAHWIQPAARRSFDSNQPITYFEIGGVDTSTGCAWPNFVLAAEIPSRAEWSIQSWDILVATVRPERKNIGLVPPSIQGQLVATSGFAVLRSPSPAVAAYLWGYLRSDAATEQLMRWNTGAAYPAIDDDVPLRIWMPDVSDSKMAEHGSRWMKIPVLLSASRALVSAARLLVEALIERKVTEADLIAASRAPSADRALLSRLTSKGLDAEGLPLFPDLDALDALLAECDTKP